MNEFFSNFKARVSDSAAAFRTAAFFARNAAQFHELLTDTQDIFSAIREWDLVKLKACRERIGFEYPEKYRDLIDATIKHMQRVEDEANVAETAEETEQP